MAKSIYDILTDYRTETSVPNYGMVAHRLPIDLLPTAEEFEDKDKLINWAESLGVTHACLQKGVQKFLIELRATFKAVKKGEDWTEEKGQAAVDAAEWNITKRPQGKKSDVDVANDYISSLSDEERAEFFAAYENK